MSQTPFYDATLNSDPGRYLWLVGLGPYPGPLPKPPQEDTEDPASGAAPQEDPAVPPAGNGQPVTAPEAEHDEPEPPQEELPLEPLPEPAGDAEAQS